MHCKEHPNYRGIRLGKRARDCVYCREFYAENKAKGLKETRNKLKKEVKELENIMNGASN